MIWSQHGEEIWVFWGSPFVLVNVRIKMNFSAGEYLLSEVGKDERFPLLIAKFTSAFKFGKL
jgi:hypothetical protein